MNLAVLDIERRNRSTRGGIHSSRKKRFHHAFVAKLLCADHRVSVKIVMGYAVIIIGGDARNALTARKHIVVHLLVYVGITAANTAVVHDLDRVHLVIAHVIRIMLQRPGGMVIGHEEACLTAFFHHIVDAIVAVFALVVRKALVKLYGFSRFNAARPNVPRAVIHRLKHRIGRSRNGAKMAMPIGFSPIHALVFQAVQHQKILVRQIVVRNKNGVIRDGENIIAVRLISSLHLLRPVSTVRKAGMRMQICLVIIQILW